MARDDWRIRIELHEPEHAHGFLARLGLALDAEANERNAPHIGRRDGSVEAWVIPTNEELMIARHTRALVPTRGAALAADGGRTAQ